MKNIIRFLLVQLILVFLFLAAGSINDAKAQGFLSCYVNSLNVCVPDGLVTPNPNCDPGYEPPKCPGYSNCCEQQMTLPTDPGQPPICNNVPCTKIGASATPTPIPTPQPSGSCSLVPNSSCRVGTTCPSGTLPVAASCGVSGQVCCMGATSYPSCAQEVGGVCKDSCGTNEFPTSGLYDCSLQSKQCCLPTFGPQVCDPKDQFCDPQKVNEYVSWYLNGTVYRPEYEPLGNNEVSRTKLSSFSGPMNKRLPLAYLDLMRIGSIQNYIDPTKIDPEATEPLNHNQIVVCAKNRFFFFGSKIPIPCYTGNGAAANGQVYRLDSWKGDLNEMLKFYNNIGTDVWNNRLPPLPWGLDQEGNPMTALKYRKYYNEWRGNTCILVPIIEGLFCFDNPLVTNEYADLFPYVPLANTVDKNALHLVASPQLQPNPGTVAYYDPTPDKQPEPPATNQLLDGDNPDIVHEPVLYYPHTLEDVILSDTLNIVMGPKDRKEGTSQGGPPVSHALDYENLGCEIVDTRSNPGDALFQSSQDSRIDDLSVYVDIQIDAIGCPSGPINTWRAMCGDTTHNWDPCLAPGCNLTKCGVAACPTTDLNPYPKECENYPGCSGSIGIKIPTTPKIPYAEDIWKSTVVGEDSTFRRIFPKLVEGAPVSCIADITGTSSTQYVPLPNPGYTPLRSIETPLGVNIPRGADGVTSSELFFPWQGTIYEYFLRGVQTALRPKGWGSPIPNGTECGMVCGELPENLPTPEAACQLQSGSVRGVTIPPSLAKILEAAGTTYHVPPQLIVGILFGEGAFNPQRGNATGQGYDWTEPNVLNWASCNGLPSCSGPETSLVGFIPVYFDGEAQRVLPDLKKLDPTIQKVDPCNLLHVIYVIASMIHSGAGGSPDLTGKSCFGITMTSTYPTTCAWNDSQYETAIRRWEFGTCYGTSCGGTQYWCGTAENGCVLGGEKTNCIGGDICETKSKRYSATSHNGCVWDVAHGN